MTSHGLGEDERGDEREEPDDRNPQADREDVVARADERQHRQPRRRHERADCCG